VVDILGMHICEESPIDWKAGCCSSVISFCVLLNESSITLSKDAQSIPSTDCKAGVRNSVVRSDGPSSDRRVEGSIKLLKLSCWSFHVFPMIVLAEVVVT